MKKPASTIVDKIGEVTEPVEGVIELVEKSVEKHIAAERSSAVKRYPRLFLLLTAFGAAVTYYGFENIADKIPFLHNNPIMMVIVGVGILTFTGTLYKKL